jgi:alkanesulfonate monooxygenase SsuD/methylene tetrahydromethanopterin reductase-like flavin-dependent oxidoreductase (luciferase family)
MQLPGVASDWERCATVKDLTRIAQIADQLGYDHLTCAEHVAVPADAAEGRGLTYWDPLSTLSYLAAQTRRIRLATSVIVLGYHHPLGIAKRFGTLDRLSGGRLVLGVGVGSLAEEFDLLGAEFADRGERADDALAALRVSLSNPRPSYRGAFYHYEGRVLAAGTIICRPAEMIGWEKSKILSRSAVIEMSAAAKSARPAWTASNIPGTFPPSM